MTRVSYDRVGLRMKIAGHANYGEYGRDIVCAAESILMLTLARQLEELEGLERLSIIEKTGTGRYKLLSPAGSGHSGAETFLRPYSWATRYWRACTRNMWKLKY